MTDSPWARGSSSKTATGTRPAPGLRSISRMAAAPVSRLPMTATRSPIRLEPRCQANRREWNRSTPCPAAREHASDHHHDRRDELDMEGPSDRPEGDEDAEDGRRGEDDLAGLLGAGMPPHPPVQAEHPVRQQRDDDGDHQEAGEVLPVVGGGLVPEVGDLGEAEPGDDADRVEEDEHDGGPDATRGHGHFSHVGPGGARFGRGRRLLNRFPLCCRPIHGRTPCFPDAHRDARTTMSNARAPRCRYCPLHRVGAPPAPSRCP